MRGGRGEAFRDAGKPALSPGGTIAESIADLGATHVASVQVTDLDLDGDDFGKLRHCLERWPAHPGQCDLLRWPSTTATFLRC